MDFYNHTRKLFANGEVDLTALKVMLLSGHSFDATHTTMTNISPDEVSGNGWAVGGPTIASAAITVTGTNESTLDGDDIAVSPDGGDIGPATAFVLYDSANSTPLFHHSHASTVASGENDYTINWNASGIARWRAPA